ncbi:Hypothetical predicted protein [Mytilus galloprovincialis]|uniref:Short-chain collagen C4 n=2 Tax=Mytilus galloprovincialis TaxID=29158 RepID=A0A8B6BR02_MYTGA|nr:Hypothetical predicted protein [Mytilus galloprovincialis]
MDIACPTGINGPTYIRWGRTDCAGDAVLVYKGAVAGKHYSLGGSGANMLCLPNDPEWNHYADGGNGLTGKIYGVEMDVLNNHQDFGTSKLNKDLPCAVCKTPGKSSVLMIPGKKTCYGGWSKEFSGYLVAQASEASRSPTEYICVDENMESVPGGDADDNEGVVYPVEIGSCKTLSCPPYVEGRELTCVVCSQ